MTTRHSKLFAPNPFGLGVYTTAEVNLAAIREGPFDAQRGSSSSDAASERDSQWLVLGQIANEVEAAVAAGDEPDVEAFAARHPELADQIRQLIATLGVVNLLGQDLDATENAVGDFSSRGRRLGDFQIVREIGRGGMGVVYEAVQDSLSRRVALKVLPFAGVLDPRQLARFKHEAQAAAALHHAHIVPVYAVGCDRGVHFYAMQYIEGRSLAELIEDLQDLSADRVRPAVADHHAKDPSGAGDSASGECGVGRIWATAH